MSEVAVVEREEPKSPSNNVLAVIERAAGNPEVDVSKMERLLDMQMKVMAKDAEVQFYDAMSVLQDQMPTIKKEGEIKVNGTLRSKYARFEDILSATKPLLKEHGFSVAFKSNFVEGELEITGTLSHRAGHHESTTMRLPFDDSGAKNKVQQIGSSVSYGKRYVYCMLLNINVSDEDDDGEGADPNNTLEKQHERLLAHSAYVRDNLPSIMAVKDGIAVGELSGAAEAWFELDQDTQRGLWVAPTKGGVFTTRERDVMKTNEFRNAYYGEQQ